MTTKPALGRKMKLRTKKSAKKRAWKMFSQYIRTRDCLKTTGGTSFGRCYTCGRTQTLSDLQASHFVSGRSNSVLFDEQGVRAACYRCNCIKGGEPLLFRRRLVEELGEDAVQMLENKRWITKSYSIVELDALYYYYKGKVEKLLETCKEEE